MSTPTPRPRPNLLGSANVTRLKVNGMEANVLIDTGAKASTISEHFAQKLDLKVLPVRDLIRLYDAGNHEIPFIGYVEADLQPLHGTDTLPNLFLVTTTPPYSLDTHIVIGTNFLDAYQEEVSNWSRQWKLACDSHVDACPPDGVLGAIKTSQKEVIEAGHTVVIEGTTAAQGTYGLVDEANNCKPPSGLLINPTLVKLERAAMYNIRVEVTNTSKKAVMHTPVTVHHHQRPLG